jgi:hypothetical protein
LLLLLELGLLLIEVLRDLLAVLVDGRLLLPLLLLDELLHVLKSFIIIPALFSFLIVLFLDELV